MAKPLVTVVMPVFDTDPQVLKVAVESAKGQSYPAIEIIVVDDGSTRQDTVAALDALSGVTLVRQSNLGPGAAANAGIRAGCGEYVLNFDSDDVMESRLVELLVEVITASPDIVIAYPEVEKFGTEAGLLIAPSEVRVEHILIYNCIVATSLVSRHDWDLAGGFDEHRDCSHDWPLWGGVLGITGGRAVKVPGARLHYRRTGDTMNVHNRQRQRIRNARRHIAGRLPEDRGQLYSTMLLALHDAEDRMTEAQGDAKRWRRVAPVLDGAMRAAKGLRNGVARLRRPGGSGEAGG